MSFLQRIFRRPDYRSDVTQFIDQMKTDKPDLEAQVKRQGGQSDRQHGDLGRAKDRGDTEAEKR